MTVPALPSNWPTFAPRDRITYAVSESTIDKWLKRWRDTGSVAALPFAGGRERVLKACTTVIRVEVQQQPDVTLAELCERVAVQKVTPVAA